MILVSCDAAPSRQAWREKLQLGYTLASDFWPHGAATKAYGVFNEERGAPVRGTFLIDKTGVVVWSLVNRHDSRREELASAGRWPPRTSDASLATSGATTRRRRSSACTGSRVTAATSPSSPSGWPTAST